MESSISMSGKKTENKVEKIAIDAGSFKELYEAHYKQIYNYISLRINNHWDTGDLVSQVFEKSIEKYASYHSSRGNFEAWLMGIAKNTVNDYYRKKQKHTFISIENLINFISLGKEPEEILVVKESNARLVKALSKLSKKEREIIALKFSSDLKNTDIAEISGMSASNIGVILFRSMKKLRKELEKEDSSNG